MVEGVSNAESIVANHILQCLEPPTAVNMSSE